MSDDLFSSPNSEEEKEITFEERVAKQLADIKREDGSQMFDSIDKAFESLMHAQKYIPELKSNLKAKEEEVNALNSQLEKAAKVEDVLDRLNPKDESPNANPGGGVVDEDKLGELVKAQMNNLREAEQIAANREQVNQALLAKFGDAEKAKLALEAKAKELGVGTEFLGSMADKSPKAILAYFSTAPSGASTPSTSSVHLHGTKPETPQLEEFSLSKTSSRDQLERLRQIRQSVYKKYEVQ